MYMITLNVNAYLFITVIIYRSNIGAAMPMPRLTFWYYLIGAYAIGP